MLDFNDTSMLGFQFAGEYVWRYLVRGLRNDCAPADILKLVQYIRQYNIFTKDFTDYKFRPYDEKLWRSRKGEPIIV